jgi:transposase-like protein
MEFSPDECDRCGAKVKPDIDFDDIKRWLWKYKGINKELLIKCGVIGG